ncbi:MAG: DUF393 domain-containing protein [Chitinophagaceae bacterium]|nr:DUF393 domain-containing protein [Chitinophagaceae bacterium]
MKQKLLIYDDNCPLCAWYSNLFVQYGLLQPEERKPFSTIDHDILVKIDFDKAKDEIPYVDTASGNVLYGIDALVAILSAKMPWLPAVTKVKPVNWFLRKLYKLISYNRKVIVAKKCGKGDIDCAPSFNVFYRLLFLVLSLAFNSAMVYPIHRYILSAIPVYTKSFYEVETAHFILVVLNYTLAFTLPAKKAFEYLGQVNMLALETVLLLLPLIPLLAYFSSALWIVCLYFLLLTIFIISEYLRRMNYAGIITCNRWLAAINITSFSGIILYIIS